MTNKEQLETQEPKKNYLVPDKEEAMPINEQIDNPNYKASGKLEGKVALITGADSGIGAAVAIAFAKEGAKLALVDIEHHEDADEVIQSIKALGQPTLWFTGDVGDPSFAEEVISKTVAEYGTLDILVNNAAEQHAKESIADITPEQLHRTFQTNIFSMFYFVKAALPHLSEGSSIINSTSVTAYQGNATLMDYASTKGAIVAFTRSLSQNNDFLSKKIRVNGVAPGPIWTPLIPATTGTMDKKEFGASVPMERAGEAYELAPAYVYLASSDSSYVSGQVIHVNGGTVVNG